MAISYTAKNSTILDITKTFTSCEYCAKNECAYYVYLESSTKCAKFYFNEVTWHLTM